MSNSQKPLKLYISDIDFFIEEDQRGNEEPIIRIRGKSPKNETIILHLKDFYPYFYIDDLPETTVAIQSLLQHEKEFDKWIKNTEHLSKNTYYQNKQKFLYKITGRNPAKIIRFCNLLKDKGINSHENDIPYIFRFLIDTNIKCLNWIEVRNYKEPVEEEGLRIFEVKYDDISHIEDESEYRPVILSLKIIIDTIKEEEEKKKPALTQIVDRGDRKILAISLTWGSEKENERSDHFILETNNEQAEKKMIETVWKKIHSISPDVIITFNGNKVDLPYLIRRMEKYDIPLSYCTPYANGRVKSPTIFYGYRFSGYMVYDLRMKSRGVRISSGKKGLSDYVKDFLGKTRIIEPRDINILWHKAIIGRDKDAYSNLKQIMSKDTQFIHSLFFELGMENWLEIMKIVGIPPSKGIYSTARHLGEFALLRILNKKNTIIPPYPTKEELAKRKSDRPLSMGGFVMTPKGTLHDAVLIADFQSMYPSTIITHNIGGESFKGITYGHDKRFHQSPDTGLRIMEREILEERKKVKKQINEIEVFLRSFSKNGKEAILKDNLRKLKIKSNALKVIANSMYGAHNYVGSRFFNTDISNAITHFSKSYIEDIGRWTKEYSNGKCEIIYGDTDSVFIKLSNPEDVFRMSEDLKKGIQFSLDKVPEVKNLLKLFSNKLPKGMDLEFVDLATRIIFAKETKKRYSYISAITGELIITGFEAIRADTALFTKELQTLALREILETGDYEKTRKSVIEKCIGFQELSGRKLIKQTTVYGPVKKHPNKYKNKTPAIAALLDYSKTNEISIETLQKEYERFPYIITKGSGNLNKRAKHPSLVKSEEIDKNHYMGQALRTVQRLGINVEVKDIKIKAVTILDYSVKRK